MNLFCKTRCNVMDVFHGCTGYPAFVAPPPSVCARNSNFGNYWSSAPSGVDTVRLPKELCTRKICKPLNVFKLNYKS